MPGSCRHSSEGSVLLEAITGIGMLVVLTVSLLTFNGSALAVHAQSEATVGAVRLAREVAELQVLDASASGVAQDESGASSPGATEQFVVEVEEFNTSVPDLECVGQAFADVDGVRVRIARGSGATDAQTLIVLPRTAWPVDSRSVPAGHAVGAGRLLLDTEVPSGVNVTAIPLTQGGNPATVHASGDRCIALPVLAPGRHTFVIVTDGEQRLVDRSHRTADEASRTASVLDAPIRIRWGLQPAARLAIDVDTDGARPPDRSSSGGFVWMIRDDDDRDSRDIGVSRDVHPGRLTVVVSACRNPDAPASATAVTIGSGDDLRAVVHLATVTVQGVDAWSNATLSVTRTTGCGDGSGLRPSLRWDAGLHDGLRIALPHGEWEARLETASGTGITAPVRITAGADAVSVELS